MKEIPDYKKLTTSEREAVRETLRFAKEYGASKADQILFGRISAKSGLAIHLTDKVPGGDVAFFDGKNTIYLDANAPRTRSYKGLLGHEVWHKMFKSPKVKGLFQNALNNIDPGKRAEVKETYIEDTRQSDLYTEEEIANISDEEVAAAYAEELFNEPHIWDIVLDGEPTLKDRVLAFFKLAPKKYSFAPEMDPAAKEWITEYKKLFDEISAENKGEVKVIGRVLPEGESPSVKVIGRVVEDNGLEPNNNTFGSYNNVSGDSDNVKTTNQQKMYVSGRSAVAKPKFLDYDKPISLVDVELIHQIAAKDPKLSINKFTAGDIEATQKWAHKFYQELGVKSPFFRAWFGDWRAYDKSHRMIVSVPTIDVSQVELATGDYIINDTGWTVYAGKTLNDDTRHHTGGNRINVKSLSAIEQILNNAILLDTVVSKPDTNKKSPNTAFLHKLYTLIEYEGQTYIAKTSVEEFYNQGKNGVSRKAYNLKAIKIEPAGGQFRIKNSSSSVPVTDSIYSISDLYDFVKTYDKDFTPAPEVNPALLNEDGTPKVFYHGTNADFTVFEKGHKRTRGRLNLGEGYYFAASKTMAENYKEGSSGRVVDAYVTLKNPYEVIGNQFTEFEMDDIRSKLSDEDKGKLNYDNVNQFLEKLGYDGIIGFNYSGNAKSVSTVVAFKPEQIKSATDNIGTFSKYEKDIRYALTDSKKATSSDVARVKGAISEAGIDPRGIMALSDSYFSRYDGSLTRTGLRYEFLDAARTMLQSDSDAYDRAFAKIEAIAEELTLNERDGSGFSNDLKEIQSHIREITFALKDQDKGEFDSLGGFNEFRKKHFGKLKIANEGASVDSVYGELQTLYGLSLFPDQNTVQEMLIQIADVLDMDWREKKRFIVGSSLMKRFYVLFFHQSSCQIADKLGGAFDTQGRGVDRQVVVIKLAPLVARVKIVVCRTALVGLVDNVDDLRGFHLGVSFLNSRLTVLKVTVDKQTQYAGLLAQNVISASADIYTAAFLCVFSDNLRLQNEELVIQGHLVSKVHCRAESVRAHCQSVEQAVCCRFLRVSDNLLVEIPLGCDLGNKLLVVNRNVKSSRNSLSDFTSAAAILTRDGDDNLLCHSESPLLFL